MPATSVSAVENYIRAEKPSSFSEIAREILLDQTEEGEGRREKRERGERERRGEQGAAKRKRIEERIGWWNDRVGK